jgi:hypothetical protein
MKPRPNTIDPNLNENLEENCLSRSTMSNISVVNNLSSTYDKWTCVICKMFVENNLREQHISDYHPNYIPELKQECFYFYN